MKRKVLAGLLSAAMVATTVFGSVGVWAAEDLSLIHISEPTRH